ncbi:hypothetical protein ABEF95_004424 [Exophiala dermatitidis]
MSDNPQKAGVPTAVTSNIDSPIASSPASAVSVTTPARESAITLQSFTTKKLPKSAAAAFTTGNKHLRASDTEAETAPKKRSRKAPPTEVLVYGPAPSTFSAEHAAEFTNARIDQIKQGDFKDLEAQMHGNERKVSNVAVMITSANSMKPNQTLPQIFSHVKAVSRTVDELKSLMNEPNSRSEVLHAAVTVQTLGSHAARLQEEIDELNDVRKTLKHTEVKEMRNQVMLKETQLAHLYAQEIHGVSAIMERSETLHDADVLLEALGRLKVDHTKDVGAEVPGKEVQDTSGTGMGIGDDSAPLTEEGDHEIDVGFPDMEIVNGGALPALQASQVSGDNGPWISDI